MNDGMPTHVAGGGSRQSFDSIGTIDGASSTQSCTFSSVELEHAAGEGRAAGEVREVRTVADLRRVVEDVAVGALVLGGRQLPDLTASRAAPVPPAGRPATPATRPSAGRSPGTACRRARARSTRRRRPGTCRARSASIVLVFVRPGITSFLPASSGTQNEWMTLSEFCFRKTFVPTGMCSSVLVTTFLSTIACFGSSNSHHHCLPMTVTWRTSGPFGSFGQVEDRRHRRHGDDREDQGRDDRPADLERGAAVDLLRVVGPALAVTEPDREVQRSRRPRRSR